MNIASVRFSLCFSVGAVLCLAPRLAAADQPGAASQRTVVKPNELVLVEPGAVTKKAVVAWKNDGLTGVVAVLGERFSAKTYESSSKAAHDTGLDLYYWIEVGRNPKLAAAHPEWMASLGMHTDWLKRFPHAKTPEAGEVAKAFPWVSINYREAFDAHLARIDRLLRRVPRNYRGILLNDLQGGPASCGCGNLQCRWATDYHVPATAKKFEADDAAARFVAVVQAKLGSKEVIPVWTTECDKEDLPKEKRAGEWTTGYSGTVGCAVGSCPKVFTQQFTALTTAHRGNVGILALHRELGRVFPEYGATTSWVGRTLEYLDRTLPNNGGQAMPHERLWLVVQGYGVSQEEEKAARQTAARTGVGAVIVARAWIDQSFEPRMVPVKK